MIATLLSLIGASGAGCHSGIELRPDQLVQLASFQPGGSMEVSTAYGEHVPIEAARAPELILRGTSLPLVREGLALGYSDLILRAPLERFRFEPSRVVLLPDGPPGEAGPGGLPYRGPQGQYDVPVSAVRLGEIVLGPPAREPWGARWGIGASLAGPSRLASANFELRLFRHVALEVGLLSLGPGLIAWAGGKVISPRIHRVALFAGGFVGAIGGGDPDKEAAERHQSPFTTSRGVRFGLELMLRSWADAISVEVDFFRQDSGSSESFAGCRDGSVCPFAGASYVHFF